GYWRSGIQPLVRVAKNPPQCLGNVAERLLHWSAFKGVASYAVEISQLKEDGSCGCVYRYDLAGRFHENYTRVPSRKGDETVGPSGCVPCHQLGDSSGRLELLRRLMRPSAISLLRMSLRIILVR